MPNHHFGSLDETTIFQWIQCIRDAECDHAQRSYSEQSLHDCLIRKATWLARLPWLSIDYDAEQVANDSICDLIVDYIRDPSVPIPTCVHLVSLLCKITVNKRRQACRRNTQAKRSPYGPDGNRLPMESIDASNCNCQANSEDPTCIGEEKEDFGRCIQLLNDPLLQQVFVMLYSNYTRNEMAAALDLDPKIIRIHIREVRQILQSQIPNPTPHTSHLTPHTSHLKPQASSLKPQASSLLLNDQAHHSNSLFQRIGYAAVGVG